MSFVRFCLKAAISVAMVACLFSCAHTPDVEPVVSHSHVVGSALPAQTLFVVRGHVTDIETGLPVRHAVVYLVDIRRENWECLEYHYARLGSSDREGRIDLAATWATMGEHEAEYVFRPGFDMLEYFDGVIGLARARELDGNSLCHAIVVSADNYVDEISFHYLCAPPRLGDGDRILDLGELQLLPRRMTFMNDESDAYPDTIVDGDFSLIGEVIEP